MNPLKVRSLFINLKELIFCVFSVLIELQNTDSDTRHTQKNFTVLEKLSSKNKNDV